MDWGGGGERDEKLEIGPIGNALIYVILAGPVAAALYYILSFFL